MRVFYVYAIFVVDGEVEVIRYVGKGHRRPGYDRIECYLKPPHIREAQVSKEVHDRLVELEAAGIPWSIRVIAEHPDERSAFAAEKSKIEALRDLGAPLWNLRDGGHLYGSTLSADSRLKMSLARIGRRTGEARMVARIKMSEAARGRKLSEETRRKIGESNRTKKRDSRIFFSDEALVVTPRRQPPNARMSVADEVAFLRGVNGKTAAEIHEALGTYLGRPTTLSAAYSLIRRYGGTTLLRRLSDEEKRERRIRMVVNRNREVRAKALGIDVDAIVAQRERHTWGPNKRIYVVHGPSCSGKSTVCEALEARGFHYVRYDASSLDSRRVASLVEATHQERTIVFDVLRNALSWKSRFPMLDVRFACIIEDEAVILERAAKRGATISLETLRNRLNRAQTIGRMHGDFSGTAQAVFDYLVSVGSTATA